MTNIVDFPDLPPAEGYSEGQIENLYAQAFRDLESSISDCETMGQIAAQYMGAAQCADEKLAFSVFQLRRMLTDLKAEYHAKCAGKRS